METKSPERVHGSRAGEGTDLPHHAVGISAIQQVIIAVLARLGIEVIIRLVAVELRWRSVVPEKGIALGRMQQGYADLRIHVLQMPVLSMLVETAPFVLAQAEDRFIGLQGKGLTHAEVLRRRP